MSCNVKLACQAVGTGWWCWTSKRNVEPKSVHCLFHQMCRALMLADSKHFHKPRWHAVKLLVKTQRCGKRGKLSDKLCIFTGRWVECTWKFLPIVTTNNFFQLPHTLDRQNTFSLNNSAAIFHAYKQISMLTQQSNAKQFEVGDKVELSFCKPSQVFFELATSMHWHACGRGQAMQDLSFLKSERKHWSTK